MSSNTMTLYYYCVFSTSGVQNLIKMKSLTFKMCHFLILLCLATAIASILVPQSTTNAVSYNYCNGRLCVQSLDHKCASKLVLFASSWTAVASSVYIHGLQPWAPWSKRQSGYYNKAFNRHIHHHLMDLYNYRDDHNNCCATKYDDGKIQLQPWATVYDNVSNHYVRQHGLLQQMKYLVQEQQFLYHLRGVVCHLGSAFCNQKQLWHHGLSKDFLQIKFPWHQCHKVNSVWSYIMPQNISAKYNISLRTSNSKSKYAANM